VRHARFLALALLPSVLAPGCGGAQPATRAAGGRPSLTVRVAPVVVEDVVYQIKALGSLEAQDLVHVTAEVEGAVTDVRFHEGDRVSSETVLLRIDPERYRLEAESLHAKEGDTVNFRVASREFPARIYHVGQVADPTTRQVEVLAWVTNPGVLKPGFFAEVTLAAESRKNALVVPEGAVQASERGFVIYAVEDGKARLRTVQIGLRTAGGRVEIVSGLQGGETVVVEGSDRLAEGVPLQAAPVPPRPEQSQ
jgi:multidrug efflux pump subunit AcrA (membrane-fusion protein)